MADGGKKRRGQTESLESLALGTGQIGALVVFELVGLLLGDPGLHFPVDGVGNGGGVVVVALGWRHLDGVALCFTRFRCFLLLGGWTGRFEQGLEVRT